MKRRYNKESLTCGANIPEKNMCMGSIFAVSLRWPATSKLVDTPMLSDMTKTVTVVYQL